MALPPDLAGTRGNNINLLNYLLFGNGATPGQGVQRGGGGFGRSLC